MRRKPRKGEFVCRCRAYKFPHRFGSGRCCGFNIVEEQWESNYGGGECTNCSAFNPHECEVYTGKERVTECPVWQDFVRYNEIKL